MLSTFITGWEVVAPLSEGRYTTTYRARSRASNFADYVIKVPRDDQDPLGRSLVQREAFVGQTTNHTNLTTVLQSHVEAPPFFLVSPYFDGEDAGAWLRKLGRIPLGSALWIVRQVAEAAHSLHEAGWIHRDIKPANVIVSPIAHATLIDLGFATTPSRVLADELACTPSYSAPEHFCSTHPLTAAADVYSLGVSLFELITGVLPFPNGDPHDMIATLLRQTPQDPRKIVPSTPHRVVRLLKACLAKQPLRRPGVLELVDWLKELEIEYFCERAA